MKKALLLLILFFLALQLFPVEKTNPIVDATKALQAEPNVASLLQKSCYDCHSYETKWPSYASIAPFSFVVASHVNDGRKALNFSEYNTMEHAKKISRLERAIVTVKNERMALPSYRYAHEKANLSSDEKKVLVTWFEEELKSLKEK